MEGSNVYKRRTIMGEELAQIMQHIHEGITSY